jgi:hypothetical protein
MTGQQPISDVPGDYPSGTVVSGSASAEVQPADPSPVADEHATAAIAKVSEPDLPAAERRHAIAALVASLRKHGLTDVIKHPRAAMQWVSDRVVEIAPRIPMRSLETLRAHHPGMSDEEIADRVVRSAMKATAAIGAVGGGITSVEWLAAPTLLTAPAVLAAETLAVVAVEIKMLGELQELYGQPVPGGSTARAAALVQAWASRRGVNLLVPGRAASAAVLGTAARKELRDRIFRRFGRNLTTLGPLLTGAAIAAYLNRRATRHLAEEIRRDLAKRRSITA